ncbi:hypothetical protein OSL66_24645, partial [Escherichia coli]|nr:hypothetical protein [Escherichia coli]MDA6909250.1 hypothetical protein [Escherichia coli]
MLPSETMIWQPEFTDKTLSRKPGAVQSVCIASVARTVLRAVRDSVVSVARAVWNWIFF